MGEGRGESHLLLGTGAARTLGEVHWWILKSHTEFTSRRIVTDGIGRIVETSFGQEVGGDEIRWWIFHKDRDVAELRKRSELALAALQKLKDDSTRMKPMVFETFEGLVTALSEFAEGHRAEAKSVHDYVLWLYGRDPLCPALLFTYRVWGSTRQSDRDFEVRELTPERDSNGVEHATDIVFGLVSRGYPTLESERGDMLSDAYDRDPEGYTGTAVIEEELMARVCRRSLDAFAEYFAFLRDAIRNITLDCDSYLAQKALLTSEAFWRNFIHKAMGSDRAEPSLWDFKETLEMWRARGEKERAHARAEFCERVAAFANAQGGVIVVGVSNASPREITGLSEVESKMQSIDEVIRHHTNLRPEHFRVLQVLFDEPTTGKKSCVVIAVAQTVNVIHVKHQTGTFAYPVRRQTGLDFVDPEEVARGKHSVVEDNFDYISELSSFLSDR